MLGKIFWKTFNIVTKLLKNNFLIKWNRKRKALDIQCTSCRAYILWLLIPTLTSYLFGFLSRSVNLVKWRESDQIRGTESECAHEQSRNLEDTRGIVMKRSNSNPTSLNDIFDFEQFLEKTKSLVEHRKGCKKNIHYACPAFGNIERSWVKYILY